MCVQRGAKGRETLKHEAGVDCCVCVCVCVCRERERERERDSRFAADCRVNDDLVWAFMLKVYQKYQYLAILKLNKKLNMEIEIEQ